MKPKHLPNFVYRIFGIFEFRKPIFFIRDPKLAKKLAVKDFDFFVDRKVVLDESIDKMFGKSLVSLQGSKWKDMRATLSPMFTGSKMRQMHDNVAKVAQQSVDTLKDQIEVKNDNVFEFKELAMNFTVDVIYEIFPYVKNQFSKIFLRSSHLQRSESKSILSKILQTIFTKSQKFSQTLKAFELCWFTLDI